VDDLGCHSVQRVCTRAATQSCVRGRTNADAHCERLLFVMCDAGPHAWAVCSSSGTFCLRSGNARRGEDDSAAGPRRTWTSGRRPCLRTNGEARARYRAHALGSVFSVAKVVTFANPKLSRRQSNVVSERVQTPGWRCQSDAICTHPSRYSQSQKNASHERQPPHQSIQCATYSPIVLRRART
jgi:hypothetical protein